MRAFLTQVRWNFFVLSFVSPCWLKTGLLLLEGRVWEEDNRVRREEARVRLCS